MISFDMCSKLRAGDGLIPLEGVGRVHGRRRDASGDEGAEELQMGCWSGDGIRGVGSCRDDCEWGEDFDEGEGARMGEGLGEREKGWSCEREGFVPVY
ncbi:hypothetical protein CRG98_030939 [Punica granatum]|uniref:Uncharacterized protein n=1 Tax=Punica granatum TaxID=22663 RepID=A0A2I0IXA4_PUNGR|nr:hypothetical protein CRG98_030939 [Punica granatum]